MLSLRTPALSQAQEMKLTSEPESSRGGGRTLFDKNAELVDRVIQVTARRGGFSETDGEDFRSWCLVRLLEDDCRRISGFEGRAKFSTFLSVVVANLMRDYRNMRWGKWRPSSSARRLGETAILLERLIYRDRMSVEDALEGVLSEFPDVGRRALIRLLGEIPTRYRPFNVGAEPLDNIESAAAADAHLLNHEQTELRDELCGSLDDALRSLSPEDFVILKMRFWEGLKISEIAHVLRLPQKPLYRRIDRLLKALRKDLENGGLSRVHVAELFS
jgi:RNA polymerase sigma factor (sigma-70 family)